MANVAPTITDVSQQGDNSVMQAVWTPITSATSDVCLAVSLPNHKAVSIQVKGTFGSGTVTLNGSNDQVNVASPAMIGLNTSVGTPAAISITSAAIDTILEQTLQVQPVLSGGSGTSLTITMLFVTNNPIRHR